MLRLETDRGRWATRDGGMVFGRVVWLMDETDAYSYVLVDDDMEEIAPRRPIESYIVRDGDEDGK